MTNRTFTIIKPNAVAKGATGAILDMIIKDSFRVVAMKMMCFSRNQAEKFYSVHKGKPFYGELVDFMTSGAVVVAILEKEDAVASLRKLVGATDPAKAEEGTIRRLFADDLTKNAIHASDSDDNAAIEAAWFFSEEEIIITDYVG